MNNSIPKEWKLVSFGDITTFHKQGYYTKESYSNKGVRLARITDLHGRNVLYGNMPYIEIDDNTYEQFKVEENDFLIARSGSIGRYGIAKNIPEKTVFASYLIKFQFDENKVDLDLVGYIFQYSLLNQLDIITQGSSNININAENIKTLQFYLPSEPEQKKIAEILTSVDKVIELTEIEIEKLKNLKKGIMQDLLTKGIGHTKLKDSPIGKIPENWEVVRLGEVSTKMTNGFVGTATPYYTSQREGVPYIRGLNVRPNRFDGRSLIYITKEFHEKQSRTILKKGDLLTVQSGHNGQTCVVPKEYEGANLHAVILTTLDKKKCNPYFISYFINSDEGVSKIDNILTGSTVKHINVKDFKDFLVPLPSLKEQMQISEKLDSIQFVINNKNLKLQKIKEIKKGLMQDLLTGKVRVKI